MATITRSEGVALSLECTAVAVLAWLGDYPTYGPQAERGIRFIADNCQAGR